MSLKRNQHRQPSAEIMQYSECSHFNPTLHIWKKSEIEIVAKKKKLP